MQTKVPANVAKALRQLARKSKITPSLYIANVLVQHVTTSVPKKKKA